MFIFYIQIIGFFLLGWQNNGLSEPTPEQFDLIKKMDHSDYFTREKATDDLKAMDYKAYKAIRIGLQDLSPEVRIRSQRLMDNLHSVGNVPTPFGIDEIAEFKLSSGRVVDESMLSLFNLEAHTRYFQLGGSTDPEVLNFNSEEHIYIAKIATWKTAIGFRKIGWTKEEVNEFLESITKNQAIEQNSYKHVGENGLLRWLGYQTW